MAQHDYVIDNQAFPATRADLNSVLQAIVSNNSGSSAPSTTFANQIWYDSSANILYIRNEDNDANIPLLQLDQSGDVAATLATIIDVLDKSGTNQAGTDLTIRAGAGTGTGAGGKIILQTADGGSSGSSVNPHATAVTILDDSKVGIGSTFGENIASSANKLAVRSDIGTTHYNIMNVWEHENTTTGIEQRIGWAFGDDGGGESSFGIAGYIGMEKANSWNVDSARSSSLTFATAIASSVVERMTIDSVGSIGIVGRAFGLISNGSQPTTTLADDATLNLAVSGTATAGGGLLCIYEPSSGDNAIYHVGYNRANLISDSSTSNFTTGDTDGKNCVIANNHTITFKNRTGSSRGYVFNLFIAGGFNYNQ